MHYLKQIIRDNYRMWLYLIGALALLTLISAIVFSCIAAVGKEDGEEVGDNQVLEVEYYGVNDEILTNFLNSYLTPLDVVYHDEGFNIRLLGYFSDGHCINIYYDLILDDTNSSIPVLANADYWDVDALVLADGKEIYNYGKFISNEGNTYHFYVAGCTGVDIVGSDISFQVRSVRLVRHQEENVRFNAYFNYSFTNDGVYLANQFPVNSIVDLGYYGQGYLLSIEVSPFGMAFNWREHSEKRIRDKYSDICFVKEKNGESLHIVYCRADYIYWDIPIRTSDLSYLELGNYSYSFVEFMSGDELYDN